MSQPDFQTLVPRRQFIAQGAAATLGGLLLSHGLLDEAHAASTSTPPATGGLQWHNWSGAQRATPAALPTPPQRGRAASADGLGQG